MDYLHFLYISRGSIAETEYLLHLSHRLKYLTDGEYNKIERIREETAKMLYGLIGSVKKETGLTSRVTALISSVIILSGVKFFRGL